MLAEIEILRLLQVALLLAFLGVTGLFLTLSIVNRRRMDRVLVSVPVGGVFGVPISPILFVAVLLCVLVAGILAGSSVSPLLIFGYIVGAILWGVATQLSTSIRVFDFGIVRGLIDRNAYLPWSRVEDYFVRDPGRRCTVYVFLFRDETGRQRRFEVRVPRSHLVEFSEVVDDILESRFTARRQRSRSRRQLKGM
jgi:hypothetical protein